MPFLVIALVFSACAEPRVVYKEVLIPTKCDIPKRQRPKKQDNIIAYLKEVLMYSEGLEKDLSFCRGE
ncbi:hypothetical protein LS68_009265 [Helicobacter sp. MIT 05-5293]|nr:hypothetical protein LS68_009265 [Helicobacter sp. MIT 05-5293]TLD85543.1 hypothetical protein LS69_009015 [Helicobacter sp. MIT 05-5294]